MNSQNKTPSASAPEQDPLRQITGLDLDTGLYLAANNRELYVMMLKAFADNNCNSVSTIRISLAANDLSTAERIAHSLKGLAGTIGAKELQKAAKAAENAICDNQLEVADTELQTIEELIDPLIQQIKLALIPETKEQVN